MTVVPSKGMEPFQWGRAGRRMTPEQIAMQQQIAAQLMQPDYSPIASPWQGLARVAGNVAGALQSRRANKAQEANAAETQAVLASLRPGADGKPNIAALLAGAGNPYADAGVRDLAQKQYAALTKPANATPHYWETNNGSLGMVGPDGQPQILYQDPTPKIEWITANNPDGTKSLVPMPQGGLASGGVPPQAPPQPPTAPVGKLTPLTDGGPGPQALATFPGPLQGAGRGY